MARHIVLDDEHGCAIENIAKIKNQKLGDCTETLLDQLPEIQQELAKIRKVKK